MRKRFGGLSRVLSPSVDSSSGPARLPDGSSPSEQLELLELYRDAWRRWRDTDFWPPYIVTDWAEADEREHEHHMQIERHYWEED
jgi:hypothetical protein